MSGENPYVGPRAFRTGEPLYGRASERAALLDLVVAERVVLLHAPSGAGKSSLLFAGLVPDLQAEGFVVRPPIRVGMEPPASAGAVNRFSFSALLSLAEGEAQARSIAELGGSSLAAFLGDDPPEPEVLIFDQFEEVLTVDPIDRASKHAFFADLGAALRCSQRWAVIAIREDHLAGLAPYRRALPTRLKTTFHLDMLTAEAALPAVQMPARAVGVEFLDAAARKLVDDLRQVQVQTAEGGTAKVAGPYVEPVQLQVACRDLWDRKPAEDATIDEKDVQEIGDVDEALRRYYDVQIAAVAAELTVAEAELRRWFDRALISEQGLRGQVLQGATQTQGLANTAVRRLVDTHLIRAEERRGIVWFELAHDRLIGPVRGSNARWSETHLSALDRQAHLWDAHGRPESLLLQAELPVIEGQLAQPGLVALERSFLEASRLLRRREAEARRLRRWVIGLSAFALVGVVVTLATLAAVYQLRSDAEMEKREDADRKRAAAERQRDAAAVIATAARKMGREALSRQLAATVLLVPPERAELAALYAVAASQMSSGWEIRSSFGNLLSRAPHLRALVPGTMMPIQLARDPERGVLAGLEESGRLNLWDLQTRALIAAPRAGVGHEAVVFDASRGQFVTADRDATATFYDPATGVGRSLALETGPWQRVAVSGDGARLATANAFGKIGLWDAVSGAKLGLIEQRRLRDERTIELLALDDDGDVLALATKSGELRLWRGGADTVAVPVPAALEDGPRGPPAALRFVADGALLALMGDGRLLRWTLPAAGSPGPPTVLTRFGVGEDDQGARFLGLGLATDGATAVALLCLDACTHEVLVRWEAASGRVDGVTIALPDRDVEGRRFDLVVTGDVVIGAGRRVAARVWDVKAWAPLTGSPSEVEALAVSGDRSRVAALGCAEGTTACDASVAAVWRVADRVPVHLGLAGLDERATGLAFFAGDTRLAGFGSAGAVVLWDLASGQATAAERLPSEPDALALRARGDGLLAAIAHGSGVHLWDVLAATYVPVNFRGPTLPVRALAIDPTGTRLAAGGCLRGPDAADGPDSFARGEPETCGRGGIWLWDLASGAAIGAAIEAYAEAVVALSFSGDGAQLLSVSAKGAVLVHAAADRLHDEHPLEDATIPAQGGDFAPDGLALVTIGSPPRDWFAAEAELRVWTGDPLAAAGAPVLQHDPRPREGARVRQRVMFAGDASLISSSADGVVVRDVSVEGMRRRACGLAGRDMRPEDWRRHLHDEEPPPPGCPAQARPDLPLE